MNILIKIYVYMYDSIFETVWLDAMTSFGMKADFSYFYCHI